MALGLDPNAGVIESVGAYLHAGGLVMPALVACAVVLWYALGARWVLLERGSRKNVRVLMRKYADGRAKAPDGIVDLAIVRGLGLRGRNRPFLRRYLDDAFSEFETQVKRYSTTITVVVAIAPLLGLLGTVFGLIESSCAAAQTAHIYCNCLELDGRTAQKPWRRSGFRSSGRPKRISKDYPGIFPARARSKPHIAPTARTGSPVRQWCPSIMCSGRRGVPGRKRDQCWQACTECLMHGPPRPKDLFPAAPWQVCNMLSRRVRAASSHIFRRTRLEP